MARKIAIIGGGNLGTAIAEGLLVSGFSAPADITITRRNTAPLQSLSQRGIHVSDNNIDAVREADVVIVAVKPFQVADLMQRIAPELNAEKILVSVVTGVSIADYEEMGRVSMPYFRAMPNTAIAIRESMTCICSRHADEASEQFVTDMFNQLGKVTIIDEKLMEAATILGACGTAYAMRYIRANIQGGIEIGFDAGTASLIAAQTVKGAAELLLQKGTHPEQEIDKVTTPKGCTIAGLNEMEHRGFSSSLIRGVVTSYKKIARD